MSCFAIRFFYYCLYDLKQHITDCLCCWTEGIDGRTRLGAYEGRRLLSVGPDEGVRPAAVDGVEVVAARVVPVTVESCVNCTKQHMTTLVIERYRLHMLCVVDLDIF